MSLGITITFDVFNPQQNNLGMSCGSNVTVFQATTTSITANLSSVLPTYTYEWYTNNLAPTTSTTTSINVNTSTIGSFIYLFVVHDSATNLQQSCQISITIQKELTLNDLLVSINGGENNILECGSTISVSVGNVLDITSNPNFGFAPFSYGWKVNNVSTGITTQTFTYTIPSSVINPIVIENLIVDSQGNFSQCILNLSVSGTTLMTFEMILVRSDPSNCCTPKIIGIESGFSMNSTNLSKDILTYTNVLNGIAPYTAVWTLPTGDTMTIDRLMPTMTGLYTLTITDSSPIPKSLSKTVYVVYSETKLSSAIEINNVPAKNGDNVTFNCKLGTCKVRGYIIFDPNVSVPIRYLIYANNVLIGRGKYNFIGKIGHTGEFCVSLQQVPTTISLKTYTCLENQLDKCIDGCTVKVVNPVHYL